MLDETLESIGSVPGRNATSVVLIGSGIILIMTNILMKVNVNWRC